MWPGSRSQAAIGIHEMRITYGDRSERIEPGNRRLAFCCIQRLAGLAGRTNYAASV